MTENTDIGPLLYLYSSLDDIQFQVLNVINSLNTKYSNDTCLSLGSLKSKGWNKNLSAGILSRRWSEGAGRVWQRRSESQYKEWYIIRITHKSNWGSFYLNLLTSAQISQNCLSIGWEVSCCYPFVPVSHWLGIASRDINFPSLLAHGISQV